MGRYVVGLGSKRALRAAYAGGKGAGLAWLARNGFNVPPGFVVTPAAFRDFAADRESGLSGKDAGRTPELLGPMHDRIMTAAMPGRLERAIVEAYRELDGSVAVRSSMLGEDDSLRSFAGQLETRLGVETATDLLRAVRECWASMFSARTAAYLSQSDKTGESPQAHRPAMAVVVQQMVDARAAGVAFSVDPVTGQNHVVIEAAAGLGDAVVSGRVDPDRHVVESSGEVTQTAHVDTSAPALTQEQVTRLASIVRRIASHRGTPQDVEWAWDGSDFHVLQTRPITSLDGQRVYSNSMLSEMLPGLITPLVWSVSTVSKLEHVLGRVFTALIGPNEVDFSKLARRIHSRAYADNTMLGQLLEAMGLPPNFFEVMSRDEEAEKPRGLPLSPSTIRTLLRLVRFAWSHARVLDETSAYVECHRRRLAPYSRADWSREQAGDLLERIEELIDLYSETMWYNFIGPMNMMIRNRFLTSLVRRWAPDVEPTDLICGLVGLKSLESNREISRLVRQAQGLNTESRRALLKEGDGGIRAALSETERGRHLIRSVDAFLDRYGFLSASGTDLSRKPWAESPIVIWRTLGRPAASVVDSRGHDDVASVRARAQSDVRKRLNPLQLLLFNRLLASTLAYVRLREESSLLISRDSFELRRAFLALADRLVAQGCFERRDDVFYLSIEEIHQVVRGEMAPTLVRDWIEGRRLEMRLDEDVQLPDTIYGEPVPMSPVSLTPDEGFLSGIVGCSGRVEGSARVVLDPADAPSSLGKEDILVVPFTDVSWTPLFSAVGGVVAETGGQLSHSAIVAREYGLPAVVNVKQATLLIEEGRSIVVDGNQGRVYLR